MIYLQDFHLEHGTDFYDPDCEACVIRVLGKPCYDCFGQCFVDMYYYDPRLLVSFILTLNSICRVAKLELSLFEEINYKRII